ncbi:chromobox protein homolog 5-like [Acyrthosiphon pisum]|uniref:Chromo shadow domain-containing protein n=1 Tax=Acyrthosiphon pisum TaxID=7029 RepID=A0A8R1W409_ACYPI|nr:chromobox protein homolog 5-like [Acyrthosiphon pisum]XP_008188879.1 chromobox protein homolog 5-like [Acyrthosiphon pisum]|eukprot:XP_003240818.1 PREDICTED: chromobox protein homolog 5-like [Acyrthosiphon pisum]
MSHRKSKKNTNCVTNHVQSGSQNSEPEKVIDAMLIYGNINYLIKWKDVDTVVILKSEVVINKWPQVVIRYFERITVFIK